MRAARISNHTEADEIPPSESIAAAGDRDGRRPSGAQPRGAQPRGATPGIAEAGVPTANPAALTGEGRRFAFWRADLSDRLVLRSSAARYGLALVFIAVAYLAAILLEAGTGKFTAFPFYAAVVAGAARQAGHVPLDNRR